MKLGEKIKLLRTELDMTQPELAEKAGIEQSYLSKLENDKGSPSFDIINRIAMALGTSGMALINSLGQSYIEDNLSHIPEVAAEYESVRLHREISQKKRFLLSSSFIAGGLFLFVAGFTNVFYPESAAHYYLSEGIIRTGEPDYLFDAGAFRTDTVIGIESGNDYDTRMEQIKNRIQQDTFVSYTYLGEHIIREVEGGKRKYYRFNAIQDVERSENDLILSLGLALIVSGMLGLVYSLRFKP